MSAPQIPNLNTLRRGGGSARARFGGRGSSQVTGQQLDLPPARSQQPHQGQASVSDKVVQGTDHDASVSRSSAVELGYLEDQFAHALTPPGGLGTRRYPIINRGTYVRTVAIDRLVDSFLDDSEVAGRPPPKRQIISLGAGSDTRVFRLLTSKDSSCFVYHELDFAINASAKIRAIQTSPLLRKTLGITDSGESDTIISAAGDSLHSSSYHIHPIDLRTLVSSRSQTGKTGGPSDTVDTLLPGVDITLPTILLSECCLIYLPPEQAIGVLDFFTEHLFSSSAAIKLLPSASDTIPIRAPSQPPLGLILYEPIRPDDPFGKTMVSNLATRGIQLQTLHRYSSLTAQKQRLKDHGFRDGQGAADVDFIWRHWVSEAEKERVAGIEMLDEIEEWRLLAQHYSVAWGWSNGEGNRVDVFEGWKSMESQSGN